jgi:toxin ParE1/3/4
MAAIRERVRALLRHPGSGEARDDVGKGLRCVFMERHVIFYRNAGDAIVVIRVLHQRMDVKLHI